MPVHLGAGPEPRLDGIRHEVTITGTAATLHLVATDRRGSPWRVEVHAPAGGGLAVPGSRGGTSTPGRAPRGDDLGSAGPDPWYEANARSVGAVVAAVRGEPASPLLVDWERALTLGRTAQAALGRDG